MAHTRVPVIIPVENQVREFDPKLLLACVAARRGFPAVIGSRREIDFRIASLPRGFYLAKSMTARSVKMFRILRLLGHQILAWDEEALVHPPPEVYYSRRLSPVAMPYVSHVLAWGQDNVDVLRGYPHLGATPIHVTGNPRNDFLRPELRGLFEEQAAAYRAACGDFILVNTNFTQVNSFYPAQNILGPASAADAEPQFGRAARGMSRDYALGLRNHKQALFEHFQQLIPALEQRFPRLTVVVRPHPTENPEIYRRIAGACARVHVTNEGNVVPWLLAAKALVHNGCTTGVEAYVLRVPAVSYRPCTDDRYDDGFYRLPNRASHQCFSLEELIDTLQRILVGDLGAANGPERQAMVAHYLAAQDGPLAAERIVTLLEELLAGSGELARPVVARRVVGRWQATRRRWGKKWKGRKAGAQTALEFHRHRFPALSLEAVQARLARIQQSLQDTPPLVVEPVAEEIFCVRLRAAPFQGPKTG